MHKKKAYIPNLLTLVTKTGIQARKGWTEKFLRGDKRHDFYRDFIPSNVRL